MDEPDLLWSILVPTLSHRRDKLRRVLDLLLPEAEKHGGVEVVGLHNDGEKTIADYRQALLMDARGKYVSFVDDDDLVEPDYVPVIAAAMGSGADYIAFGNIYYRDGERDPIPTLTGLQYGSWWDSGEARFRDITHINPARAVLAKQADFRVKHGDGLEDWSWISQLRGLLKTQVTIDRPMYHYYWNSSDSVQHNLAARAYAPRLEVDSPAFRWHEWSTG